MGWGRGFVALDIPTALSTFVQVDTAKAVYVCVCVCVCECGRGVSVAVGLVGVLGWLLGGSGVSHAALGQCCAWSGVLVGSMWIGALVV